MKATLLLLVCFAVCALSISWNKDKKERQMFEMWMREHNKTYVRAGEKEMRFQNFLKSIERIEKLNKKHTSAKFALNKFSDQTPEEFFRARTGPKYPAAALARSCLAKGVTAERQDTSSLPTSFDWRDQKKVTRVKDQGQCGSCWAFSTIGNIESQWAIKGHPLTEFSEQLIVDCSHACVNEPPYGNVCNQGCDGGWQWSAFTDVVSWGGVETETQYPYTGEDGNCQLNNKLLTAKITNYTCLTDPNHSGVDENQMAAVLVAKGPLSIAMDATPLMDYDSGVLNPTSDDCTTDQLDHALLIVGFAHDTSSGLDYWSVKNSWSNTWGEQGYFRIVRGQGACGINNAVSIAVM